MRRLVRLLLTIGFATLSEFAVAEGPSAEDAPFFRTRVRPLLSEKCSKCHGPGTQEADLRLDVREAAVAAAVVPGSPDASELIRRVAAADEIERMPPAEAGEPLTSAEVDVLREWVRRGAPYAPHWAYDPIAAAVPPTPRDSTAARSPIDAFVLARLDAAGLSPSPEADRETLIRRVSLDLVGLPPTPEQVDAFVADSSPDAYERIVDRLLASPHYGERQARHWLDLARYADSNGYTIDGPRSIWPYRDWVIRALNANLPFDRFTIEQLAGDLLPDPTTDQLIATGFQRNTPHNEEGGIDPEQFRVERTVDRTNTIGAVWLGLTVGCAQCHDHKYDAFSIREYYSLYAFFDSADEATLPLPTPEQRRRVDEAKALVKRLKDEAGQTPSDEAAKAIKAAEADLKKATAAMTSTLVFRPRPMPRETHVHQRGDFLSPGDPVAPGTPAALPPLDGEGEVPTRLDLARWLVRPDHPLTPRVVVNREWQRFFGLGLVETENDFGTQGSLPSHPELLDRLAADFVADGWGLKRLHRRIVTSATYRQASVARPDAAAVDPRNRLLARQNRLRLEAEAIRDAALAASGLLAPKLGGPGVHPPQPAEVFSFTQSQRKWEAATGPDRYRRGLYTYLWRQSQHPLLTTFDGADAQTACTRRNRSNTPLQALHLANDAVFVELALALADRVAAAPLSADADRIDHAFQLCFARGTSPEERDVLLALLRDQRARHPETAWPMVARTLLNLDEFVTRE